MRLIRPALALLLAITGCRSPDDADNPRPPMVSAKGGGMGPRSTPIVSTNTAGASPVVLPASGRVHVVNAGLRFVVVDYTLGGMPALQSLLPVFRNEEKVGQIRLSGPERNGFVAADVIEGFLQVDDEVRLH